jgi:hypothetical protein
MPSKSSIGIKEKPLQPAGDSLSPKALLPAIRLLWDRWALLNDFQLAVV